MTRLGVNIDHVATLRQARGEDYPSIVRAAHTVIDAGADQITIHLRADRRHIQDFDVSDVAKVTRDKKVLLNLEFGLNEEISKIAVANKPDWICIVPEKREERTTEGGLDLENENTFLEIKNAVDYFKKSIQGVKISLFIEANLKIIDKVLACDIDAVEIHTGKYAKLFCKDGNFQSEIDKYHEFYEKIKNTSIGFHAGHGLTIDSVKPLVKTGLFKEYNIGHWIISESIFLGLDNVVRDLNSVIKGKV